MDLKTIVLDSRSAVVERMEFSRDYNDRQRGDSDATDLDKESWAGAVGTVDLFAEGRTEMRLLDSPDSVQTKIGEAGGRLTNGREDPGNQGCEIETLAAGSGTHSMRRNGEYR